MYGQGKVNKRLLNMKCFKSFKAALFTAYWNLT